MSKIKKEEHHMRDKPIYYFPLKLCREDFSRSDTFKSHGKHALIEEWDSLLRDEEISPTA